MTKKTPKESKSEEKKKNQPSEPDLDPYLKYSSLGIQMAVIIAAGVGLGYWLDEKFANTTPWYTIGIGLFGIFAALYISLKDFFKN